MFSALPLDPPATVSEWMTATERLYHNQLSRNLNVDGYGGRGHTPSVPYPVRNNQQPKPFVILPRKDPEFNRSLPQVGQVRPAEGSGPRKASAKFPCYKCGSPDHWANSCPQKQIKSRIRMLAEEEALLMEDDELDEWLELVKQQKALDRDTQDIAPTPKEGEEQDF